MSKEPHLFVDSCIPSETAGDSTLSVTRSFYPDGYEKVSEVLRRMLIQYPEAEEDLRLLGWTLASNTYEVSL